MRLTKPYSCSSFAVAIGIASAIGFSSAALISPVEAQSLMTGPTFAPVRSFPSFIASGPELETGKSRWEGGYAGVSTGFSVTKFRRGPTIANSEVGLATGYNWREGNLLWGVEVAGNFSPTSNRISGVNLPIFADYNNNLSGIARIKGGVLLSDNLLVYSSIGVVAQREQWRSNTQFAPNYAAIGRNDDVRVAPDIRAGVQWKPVPGLTLGLEVGAQGGRW